MNEKRDYVVGDVVRIVFESYFDMAKSDYSQLYNMDSSNRSPNLLDLGGVYIIENISSNKWGVQVYDIRNRQDHSLPSGQETINHLCLLDNAPDCQYQLDDVVLFNPSRLQQKDLQLPFLKEMFTSKEPLIINRIIMDFYVFVQRQSGGILYFPIKWTDMSVV
ncbi:hypothetical protein [Marispirochaeta sp.]|uniref:hypothetical protein n=1 Tax=Marispirochaeta sp. TaxID=2038653 RepID=UPI0029C6FC34|nr:hypothetical protein [Marispirochaeta sp.]